MTKQITEFRVGRVFGRVYLVFAWNFFKFVMVTGIGSLPWFHFLNLPSSAGLATLSALFVAVVTTVLSQAVVLLVAFQGLRGMPISLSNGLRGSLRNFFTLVALGLVLAVQLTAIGFAIGSLGANTGLVIFIAVIVLSLFFHWSVAMSACVIEGFGLFSSLSRSGEVIRGYRLRVLTVMLAAVVTSALIAILPILALRDVSIRLLVFGLVPFTLHRALSVITLPLWIAIWTAFLAVLFAVIYYELPLAKDHQIVAVFD